MPTTSRAFVKASILYLCLGAVLGALFLVNRWLPFAPRLMLLRASHVQALIVGWLTQFILGIAWWLFPPLKIGVRQPARPGASSPARRGQRQRGSEPLFWATFACLNLGVLLRVVFEPLHSWTQAGIYDALSGLSGPFLATAALAFVANMWQRVRALGRRKAVTS
jgi:hypothetical protein